MNIKARCYKNIHKYLYNNIMYFIYFAKGNKNIETT